MTQGIRAPCVAVRQQHWRSIVVIFYVRHLRRACRIPTHRTLCATVLRYELRSSIHLAICRISPLLLVAGKVPRPRGKCEATCCRRRCGCGCRKARRDSLLRVPHAPIENIRGHRHRWVLRQHARRIVDAGCCSRRSRRRYHRCRSRGKVRGRHWFQINIRQLGIWHERKSTCRCWR